MKLSFLLVIAVFTLIKSDEILFIKSSCDQGRIKARTILDDVSLTTVLNNGDFQDGSIDCSLLSQNSSLPILVSTSPGSVDLAISSSFSETSFGIGIRASVVISNLTTIFTLKLDEERSLVIKVSEVKLNGNATFSLQSVSQVITGDIIISYVINFNLIEHSCCVTSNVGETCFFQGVDLSDLTFPAAGALIKLKQKISFEELLIKQIVLIRGIDALINFEESNGLDLGNVNQFEDLLPDLEEVLKHDDEEVDENDEQLEFAKNGLILLLVAILTTFFFSIAIFVYVIKVRTV